MIVIDIDPTLLVFDPLVISWHGFFSAVGIIVGIWFAVRLARGTSITEDHILGMSMWGVPAGIIGARLFHVVDKLDYYSQDPAAIFAIQEGGLAIYGGIIGGVMAGALYARRAGIRLGLLTDVVAPALILGQAIGRIGDVINGEHRGLPADLPWAVTYTNPNTLGKRGVPVHPAIGYELLWDLLIFGILLLLRRRSPTSGVLFWTYAILYATGRFAVGFFRQDTPIAFGMGQAQVVALLIMMVVAVIMMIRALPVARPIEER